MQVFCGSNPILVSQLLVWISILSQPEDTDAQEYQWSCNAVNTDFYTLPDLSMTAFGFISPLRTDDILIYPLPPTLNCRGTVTKVLYKYGISNSLLGTDHLIFTILTLKQNGLSLTVTDVIPIHSTPTNQKCIRAPKFSFCLDIMPFGPENQFHLPASNFAFGIIPTDISLLAYRPIVPIRVGHHRLNSSGLNSQDTISVDNTTLDLTLRFLKFIIIPAAPTEQPTMNVMTPTTETPSTDTSTTTTRNDVVAVTARTPTTNTPTAIAMTTNAPVDTVAPTTAGGVSTDSSTTTTRNAAVATGTLTTNTRPAIAVTTNGAVDTDSPTTAGGVSTTEVMVTEISTTMAPADTNSPTTSGSASAVTEITTVTRDPDTMGATTDTADTPTIENGTSNGTEDASTSTMTEDASTSVSGTSTVTSATTNARSTATNDGTTAWATVISESTTGATVISGGTTGATVISGGTTGATVISGSTTGATVISEGTSGATVISGGTTVTSGSTIASTTTTTTTTEAADIPGETTTMEAITDTTSATETRSDPTPEGSVNTPDTVTNTPTTAGGAATTTITAMASSDDPLMNTPDDGSSGTITSGGNFASDAMIGRNDDGGSSTVGAVVGGVIGVVVAVALLIAIALCVTVLMLKRRSKVYWKLDEGEGVSYPNAVYGSDEQYSAVRSDYIGVEPHPNGSIGEAFGEASAVDLANSYEQISEATNHEYSYAENRGEVIDDNMYEAVDRLSVREQSMAHSRTELSSPESIYQVPGKDEDTLYAQLNEITTGSITRDSVLLRDLLGSGQFGTVYKGVWQSNTRGDVEVAVKILNEGSQVEDRVKFLQEAAIMGQFKHPNVVEMHGVVTEGEPILLILELLTKGDLRDHLLHMRSDEKGVVSVDAPTLLSYCRQVASGMAYLSSKAFVHRDLAARNILVSDDNICKIADFGMSRDLADESYYISHGGMIPVKWTAPEALHYKKYSTASDVWSYGALIYEIWSVGHKPFEDLTNNKVLRLVDTGYRLPPPPGCPRAIYAIMMSCWHPEPSRRPSFANIISTRLSHPNAQLLQWAAEDKSAHPDMDKLGADLFYALHLYKDLQTLYKQERT